MLESPTPRPDRATAIALIKDLQLKNSTDYRGAEAEAAVETTAIDMRARAMALAEAGFPVFRCVPGKKKPAFEGWQAEATFDVERVRKLWTAPVTGEAESYNIGLHTGGKMADGRHFFVVDLDSKGSAKFDGSKPITKDHFPPATTAERYAALIAATDLPAGLPQTFIVRTPTDPAKGPTRGAHLFFRCPLGAEVKGKGHILPGVEIKGVGALVVALGSVIDSAEYEREPGRGPAELDDAPEGLLSFCGKRPASAPDDRTRKSPYPVCELDLPRAFEHAREWIRDEAPEGNRDATKAVIYKLGDFGLSAPAIFDLILEEGGWNDTKADPPWAGDDQLVELEDFVEGLCLQSRNSGIGSFFPPDPREVFEAIGGEVAAPASTGPDAKRPYIFADEGYPLALTESVEPLVEDWLGCGELSCFYGAAGAGKSFVAIGIAMSIARGVPWAGCATMQGLVFYVAMEGGKGMLRRLAALRKKMDLPPRVPFVLSAVRFDLSRGNEGANALAAAVKQAEGESGQTCRLIVIDTVARAMGGNDSDAGEMGAFVRRCDMIREATGAHVMLIHHSGKKADAGARGSTVLLAAVDTETRITKGVIKNTKQREMEDEKSLRFTLETVALGLDTKGRAVTSSFASVGAASVFKEGLTPGEQWALDRFKELHKAAGGALPVLGADWNRDMEKAKVAEGRKKPSRPSLSDWRRGLIAKMTIREVGDDRWALA